MGLDLLLIGLGLSFLRKQALGFVRTDCSWGKVQVTDFVSLCRLVNLTISSEEEDRRKDDLRGWTWQPTSATLACAVSIAVLAAALSLRD